MTAFYQETLSLDNWAPTLSTNTVVQLRVATDPLAALKHSKGRTIGVDKVHVSRAAADFRATTCHCEKAPDSCHTRRQNANNSEVHHVGAIDI